ncbi:CRISPR-associated Cas6 family protein 2 [Thermococcus cleftensis]|uniref:CRISPR-associated Cas6 family protein 2 n=1 Tax=Thermococcus cleftensis (strain DSM 27260 / KACC 17922 / CL1) TaxID=163003 RepID=I3ZWD0_THECF|nr:CRISPR-associated endoribonuclease Cas6 [Thermococcus cleftensis]AFL96014.1 CRISPR-associated Cas6 family protein 2 [Thermococcus cleftensis]
MRLKITLEGNNGVPYQPNKHAVQGFIYNMLKDTEYGKRHDEPRFKFFTFSDFFRDREGRLTFLVSSPERGFIETLYSNIRGRNHIYIGKHQLALVEIKKFKVPLRRRFQTGSPVVIYRNARENEYFKFHAHHDLRFFVERLKDNAERKYNAFYGEDFALDGPLFDRIIPKLRNNGKLDVYVKVVKNGVPFPVIGSNWELLEKERIGPHERKFYRFLMDAGLGEKNSLGFGFLNPVKG